MKGSTGEGSTKQEGPRQDVHGFGRCLPESTAVDGGGGGRGYRKWSGTAGERGGVLDGIHENAERWAKN